MVDASGTKPGNKQRGVQTSFFGKTPLPQPSLDRPDTSHLASISARSNSEPSFVSPPMTSPYLSCPSSPTPSFSRPSAISDKESQSPYPVTPLLDSRARSSCSMRSSCSSHQHQVLHTSRSAELLGRRDSRSGSWISPKTKKPCPSPVIPSSPLRAPPMVQPTESSSSYASTLSSDVSDVLTSIVPTSFSSTPRFENPTSGPQYKSFSDSIAETCDKLYEMLKKSLRVMWKQGKRPEGEQGRDPNTERERESMEPRATMEASRSETPKKDTKLEDTSVRRKRRSAVSICNLDKVYRPKRESISTKSTETTPKVAAIPLSEPSNSKSSEDSVQSVSDVADFVDLRDPFACHTSGAPQVVKDSASALPPPSSFKSMKNKVVEARRRARHASLGRPGSAGGRPGSIGGRPGSPGGRPGSAGRLGSTDFNNGIAGLKFDRRLGASVSSASGRRLRPVTPRRSIDSRPFPVLGGRPIIPRSSAGSRLSPPFAYTLAPVRPLRVVKRSTSIKSANSSRVSLVSPQKTSEASVHSVPALQKPATPQKRIAHVAVKSSSPFSPPSARPMTPPKRTRPYTPFVISIPAGPVTPSSVPSTPALSTAPSSPSSPLFPATPTTPTSPGFPPMPSYSRPSTPTTFREFSRRSSSGVRPTKPRYDAPPIAVVQDGQLYL